MFGRLDQCQAHAHPGAGLQQRPQLLPRPGAVSIQANHQARNPTNPSTIHSLWVNCALEPSWCGWPQGLTQDRFGCWFGLRLRSLVGRPLEPAPLVFGSCAPPLWPRSLANSPSPSPSPASSPASAQSCLTRSDLLLGEHQSRLQMGALALGDSHRVHWLPRRMVKYEDEIIPGKGLNV